MFKGKMMNREKIIEIATQLILEKGDLGWSYADIADCIKIRKASIHYYFPKKENLLEAVTEKYIDDCIVSLKEKFNICETPTEKINSIFEMYRLGFCNPRKICLCLSLSQETKRMSPFVIQKIKNYFQYLHQILVEIIIEGQEKNIFKKSLDPNHMASLIECSLQGLLIISQYDFPEEKYDGSHKQILEILLSS